MFLRDGSVKASGWTFHGAPPANVELIGYSRSVTKPLLVDRRHAAFSSKPRGEILNSVQAAAARHQQNQALAAAGLNDASWYLLFRSLIQAESAFNPNAISPKGAIGLGQLMPGTARQLGVDPHDIEQNLDGAARYFLAQLSRFGSVELALAAYNAGPHRVEEYGGVPPFQETRNYIARINRLSDGLAAQMPNAVSASTPPLWAPSSSAVLLN